MQKIDYATMARYIRSYIFYVHKVPKMARN